MSLFLAVASSTQLRGDSRETSGPWSFGFHKQLCLQNLLMAGVKYWCRFTCGLSILVHAVSVLQWQHTPVSQVWEVFSVPCLIHPESLSAIKFINSYNFRLSRYELWSHILLFLSLCPLPGVLGGRTLANFLSQLLNGTSLELPAALSPHPVIHLCCPGGAGEWSVHNVLLPCSGALVTVVILYWWAAVGPYFTCVLAASLCLDFAFLVGNADMVGAGGTQVVLGGPCLTWRSSALTPNILLPYGRWSLLFLFPPFQCKNDLLPFTFLPVTQNCRPLRSWVSGTLA